MWFYLAILLALAAHVSSCSAVRVPDVVSPYVVPGPNCLQPVDEIWVAHRIGPGPRLVSYADGVAQNQLFTAMNDEDGVVAFTLADVDGDGREELVVLLDESGQSRVVVLNDAEKAHTELGQFPRLAGPALALTAGDFDGDGRDEVAISTETDGIAPVWIFDDFLHQFHPLRVLGERWAKGRVVTRLKAAQLDNDPGLELIVALNAGTGPKLLVLDDARTQWRQLASIGQQWGHRRVVTDIAIGQLDSDPQQEIAIGRSSGPNERVLVFDDALAGFAQGYGFGREWGDSRGATALAFSRAAGAPELLVARERGVHEELFRFPLGGSPNTLALSVPPGLSVVRHLSLADADGDGQDELVLGHAVGGGQSLSFRDDAGRRFRALDIYAGHGGKRGVVSLARAKAKRCARMRPVARPATVSASKNGQAQRLERVVRAWLRTFSGDFDSLGNWERQGTQVSLRRIAAGLTALQILPENDPQRPSSDFPQVVERWLIQKARMQRPAGTDTSANPLGGREADFDFYLSQLLMLMYRFERQPELLSDDALWAMLLLESENAWVRGRNRPVRRIPLVGNTPKHMTFQVGVLFPETENHVLMINTWAYLVNQWLRNNPRGDPRVKRYYERDPRAFDNEGSALEELLLVAIGRIVRQGFFETNARPYAAYTLSALQLLYSYADASRPGGRKIRLAAQNALDYAAVKFAFQSLFGKRLAPGRRSWGYRKRMGLYTNDYVPFIFGVLSGATSYDDDPNCVTVHCAYHGTQSKGFALSSALSSYQLPDPVLDFMLHPDNHRPGFGAWSRMQTRFTNRHYIQGRWPRMDKDMPRGAPDLVSAMLSGRAEVLPAAEFYFLTREFLNTAGGRYQHYAGQDGWAFGEYRNAYDWFSRPSSLLLPGNDGYFKNLSGAEQEILLFSGETSESYRSNNLATYKNFTYGYSAAKERPAAARRPSNYGRLRQFVWGNVHFEVLQRLNTSGTADGPLVLYGELPPLSGYRRGFWEVLPSRIETARQAQECVLESNPELAIRGEDWHYVLCASGEQLTLSQDVARASQPILAIDGDRRRVEREHLPLSNRVHELPLLDVRQTDARFRLTGVRYVFSKGDGRVHIYNPYLRQRLLLDSSDPRTPRRTFRRVTKATTARAEGPNADP